MKNAVRVGLPLFVTALMMGGACARPPRPETTPPASAGAAETPALAAPKTTEDPAPGKVPPPARSGIPESEKKIISVAPEVEPDKDSAAAALEEALNAYTEARAARDRDDPEAAVQALDEAYGILLGLDLPPDSPLLPEKNDLRLLIVQRIQEIYASRIGPVSPGRGAIPFEVNTWVQREIDSFRGPERRAFEESYRRSGLYRVWIEAELRGAGLPEELVWLPMIESWFMPRALSSARALGMWQFISSTGLRYGLGRDAFIDERMDPYKSTRAAIRFLTDLHGIFGEWTTALAAYNCGEGYVGRLIASQHINYLDNFWDLFARLPFQTARYVPRFIATVLIVRNPARYGMTLPDPYPDLQFETVTTEAAVQIEALNAAAGLDSGALSFLNPELRVGSTPNRPYPLRVPAGSADTVRLAASLLPRFVPPPETTVAWHVVRSGQTLSQIAARYGTSVQGLQRLNGMRGTMIVVGQRLKVPVKG